MFINLFLLVTIGNILAIFKMNQEVLLSMSSVTILFYKMKLLFFSLWKKIFTKQNSIFFKFFINFSAIKYSSVILFLAQALHTFLKSNLLKSKFWDFRVLGSKFVKFLTSVLSWQANSSSNFVSFFIVMTQNSPVNFKLIHFLLWTKGSHENTNFDIFKCSDENLLNSSCRFWKHSQFSFKCCINIQCHQTKFPYTFFSSNIIYFVQNKPIKVQIFEIFEYSGKNLKLFWK